LDESPPTETLTGMHLFDMNLFIKYQSHNLYV
jgi:hypothetical protein